MRRSRSFSEHAERSISACVGRPRETGLRPHGGLGRVSARCEQCVGLFGGQDLLTHAPLATSRQRSRTHAWAKPCLAGTTYNAVPLHTSREFTRSENDRRPTHGRSPVWRPGATHSRTCSQPPESDHEPSHGRSPDWPPGPTRSRATRIVPRTITNPRMGEALFGGPTHDARTNATSRDEHLA
jgi:hypothetical protein